MTRPTYRCYPTPEPLAIDGDLSKPAWARTEAVPLVDVTTGARPRQATTVRLLHDTEFLYLGFHAEDAEIWGTFREHDSPVWEENALELFLDPYGPGRTYYEIAVSPHGVVFDAVVVNRQVFPDGPRDLSTLREWLCEGLEVAVRVDGELDVRRPVSRAWDLE
ncbi:MAG: carbohydrate-binding family 9-like protein, partial [Myxococcales bacterium]|nr:carbohydrate-binding family 9-like protein [Myxococcales bacterium]